MAVTHPTAIRNGIADHVVEQLDGGTIEFLTSGDAEVATLTFSATAFDAAGTAGAGIATAAAITADDSCNPGTVTKFVAKASNGTDIIFQGDVTATGGGGDIILSSTAIGGGDTISISALTYEAPA